MTYELLPGSSSKDRRFKIFTWNGEQLLDLDASEFIGPTPFLGAKDFGSDGGGNIAPMVNAGNDRVISEPTNSKPLEG